MKRLTMIWALVTTVTLAGYAGATPPGVDPALPEPADEPPNPERTTDPYYDGSVRAPAPQPGSDPRTDLGAPPALPSEEEPLFGQHELPDPEEEEAE